MDNPSNEPPIVTPENKVFNPLTWILIFVLIFAFSAAGIYVWQNKDSLSFLKLQLKVCTMEAKICPDGSSVGRTGPNCEFTACPLPKSASSSPVTQIPVGWKIYNNKDLGISIQYPANLRVINDENRKESKPIQYLGHSILIADSEDRLKLTESVQINIENTLIYEVPWSNGKIINLTKENLELFHLPGPEKVIKTEINGRYALLTQFSTNGLHTVVSIIDDKRVLKIKIDSKDESLITLHNQILSTFKFTNATQAGEMADWKTFTSQQYKFSFRYPDDWRLSNYTYNNSLVISRTNLEKLDSSQQIQMQGPGNQTQDARYEITVEVLNNSKNLSPRDYYLNTFDQTSRDKANALIKDTELAGLKGIRYSEGAAPASGPVTTILITKNNLFYRFNYGAMAQQSTHEKFLSVFDQILSTFKFLP